MSLDAPRWTGEAAPLAEFRAAHEVRRLVSHGIDYIVSGSAGPALLILNGGTLIFDTAKPIISLFNTRFRTFTPTHPALPTMSARAAVLKALLDQEGLEQVFVLGQSFGGTLVQALIAAAPDRVTKGVLSATTSPNLPPLVAESTKRILAQLADLPEATLMAMTKSRLAEAIPREPALNRFWLAVLDDLFERILDVEDVRAAYASSVDFFDCYGEVVPRLSAWQGDALIIRADDDPALAALEPERLEGCFSHARVHRFSSGGHMLSLTQREAYQAVVTRFLLGE